MRTKLFILLIIGLFGCSNYRISNKICLQEGDLLFQHLNCGGLCEAIETVTCGVSGKKFSHCALVVKVHDSLFVIEAIGGKVQLNTIEKFFSRSHDTLNVENITIGRVKENFRRLISGAISFSKKQIGQPYDDAFLLNNGKWYCSELLYESFKNANENNEFFSLSPMTFKKPGSNDFFPVWIEYYNKLNISIPEGELGINPGSISRSEKIDILKFNAIQIK